MDKENRYDLTISGSGSAAGGVYNKLRVNGEGKITGDVDCIRIKSYGVTSFRGKVKAEQIDIAGESEIEGRIDAKELKVKGQLNAGDEVRCKELSVMGSVTVNGNLSGDKIELKGALTAKGDCEAEEFTARGGFKIDGLLNADHIDVRLYGKCEVKEIGGERIRIQEDGLDFALVKWLKSFLHYNNSLVAETIEGDDIYLENTTAKVVRGNNVIIGAGCKIELVEYKHHFEQQKDAAVKENHQI